MKAVILAGGFAKRMWPLTENQAKALLPVAGKPIIEYILEKLQVFDDLSEIYVSTNAKFEQDFVKWISTLKTDKKVTLVVEDHDSENKKFGAIGGLKFLIDTQNVEDDLMVIAGDNLFEFNMRNFLEFYKKEHSPVIASYDMGDVEAVRNRFGVVVLDGDTDRVKEFQEKPAQPKSTLVSTCIYVIPRQDLQMIDKYLADDNNPDAPGFFIQWLTGQKDVRSFVFSEKWFDIGSFELYDAANKEFASKAEETYLS